MSQDIKVEEKTCLIPTFERNRYFFGKPLMVGDFEAEQQYMIGKNRLQNRMIHGAGIICGLKLSNEKIVDGKLNVEISEGAALDCCGNLIVVNKPTPVEVRAASSLAGGAVSEGNYYLYLQFSECERQPIMATTNAASCEEVCCYNRIRESFEVVLSARAPVETEFSFVGTVRTGDGDAQRGIVGARVRARQQGIVKAETLSDISGNFSLGISSGEGAFDIEASATGFSVQEANHSIPNGQEELKLEAFVLTATAGPAPAEVCHELVQKYFEGHSLTCEGCDDPKVFLGVVSINGTVSIDQTSSGVSRDRAIVYTNPMLHDLYCDHVSDFNNPHRTTAEQVRALQTVNNVGNVSEGPYVSNIDLDSNDETIEVISDPPNEQIHLQLAANAVAPRHLNDATINGLLTSDGSIAIEPNTAAKNILIRTNPATSTTSVGTAQVKGISKIPAPQDHQHDLTDGVVLKTKLGEDVINTLLSSPDGTITITPNFGARTITLKTNRAGDVTSVATSKFTGTSNQYAPADHVHNLGDGVVAKSKLGTDVINTLLTSDGTITITPDLAAKQISIKAVPPVIPPSFTVTTGLVRFEAVKIGETRPSPPIKHGLDADNFAIVLGYLSRVRSKELGAEVKEVEVKEELVIGQMDAFDQRHPLLEARYNPGSPTFHIDLRDRRIQKTPSAEDYLVRWWAIPFTSEMETVESPPKEPIPQ